MNTDEELRLEITDIVLAITGKKYLTKSSRQGIEAVSALLRKSNLQRAIDELKKVDPIASHLLAATVSDRIEKLQAELHQVEKEQI